MTNDLTERIVSINTETFTIESTPIKTYGATQVFNAIYRRPPATDEDEDGEAAASEALEEVPVTFKRINPTAPIDGHPPSPEQIFRTAQSFFRETFIQIHAQNPIVLPVVGWNVLNEDNQSELILITDEVLETLEERMKKGPPLTYAQKVIIAYGVARGMAHLHSLHVLHRNLRPANIYLDKQCQPHLADLGMAKVTDNSSMQSQRVTVDQYTAKEGTTTQFSFPLDVFAYGIILYELFSEKKAPPPGPKSAKLDLTVLPSSIQALVKAATREKAGERRTFAGIVEKCDHSRGTMLVDSEDEIPGAGAALKEWRAYKQALDKRDQEMAKDRLRGQAKGLRDLFRFPTVSPPVLSELFGAADLGDFSAQIAAGLVYLTGNAGARSVFQAVADVHENRHVSYADCLTRLWEMEGENTLAKAALDEVGGDFATAIAAYRELALGGNREAALRYGALLLLGGQEKQGVALLERFAREGSYEANYTLGDYYLRWKKDDEAALKWFREIAPLPAEGDLAKSPYPYMAVAYILAKTGEADKWGEVEKYADEVAQFDRTVSAEVGGDIESAFSRFATQIKAAKPKVKAVRSSGSGPAGRGGAHAGAAGGGASSGGQVPPRGRGRGGR
jgi:serine/threonine protein kinase